MSRCAHPMSISRDELFRCLWTPASASGRYHARTFNGVAPQWRCTCAPPGVSSTGVPSRVMINPQRAGDRFIAPGTAKFGSNSGRPCRQRLDEASDLDIVRAIVI
jgi:hypothetical protein